MMGPDNEEHALYTLRSVYHLQSALADFIISVRSLLEAGFNMVENQMITDSVLKIMRNVNELLKFCNQKIIIFSEKCTEAELYALYLKYKPIDEKQFPKKVMELYHLTKKCLCTNWKRKLLSYEIDQFLLLMNQQKKMFNEFKSYQNNPKNIWLSEENIVKNQ